MVHSNWRRWLGGVVGGFLIGGSLGRGGCGEGEGFVMVRRLGICEIVLIDVDWMLMMRDA